jgi:hypothetical protein
LICSDAYRQLAVSEDGMSTIALCNGPHLFLWSPLVQPSIPSNLLDSNVSSLRADAEETEAVDTLSKQTRFKSWKALPVSPFVLYHDRFDSFCCFHPFNSPSQLLDLAARVGTVH